MSSLRRLLPMLLPYWPQLVQGTICMVMVAGTGLLPPLLIRYAIDQVILAHQLHKLTLVGVGAVVLYGANAYFSARRTYIMHVVGQRLILDLRTRLYDHLQKLSLTYYDSRQTGDTMSRLSNDVTAIDNFVVHATDTVVVQVLTLVGVAVLMFGVLSWKLSLVVLLPMPFLLVGVIRFSRRIRRVYRQIRDRLGDINARLQDNLSGIRVIKAFGREDYESLRFQHESTGFYHANVEAIGIWSTFHPKMGFLTSLGGVGVIVVGGYLCLRGELRLGTMAACLMYADMFYRPIGELFRVVDAIQQAAAAADRVFEILDQEPDVADAPDARELAPVKGMVEFRGVHFGYASGEEVLTDINLVAQPGQRVALVGRSGAGKTSIVNLIPRFYDATEGQVLVDGEDVRAVTQRSLRRQTALVLQETFLFNGTVRENIAYGSLEASPQEIETAARAAYLHDFIIGLPEGYDTEIGERGVKLSGGQKQRMAIARAVLANPRILILDEATSAVDSESEYYIHRALEELMQGRTTFIIAHRLSTIKRADLIVVLEEGRIVETGSHQRLLRTGGVYAQMYDAQFRLEIEPERPRPELPGLEPPTAFVPVEPGF